jgi:hypothetical protein
MEASKGTFERRALSASAQMEERNRFMFFFATHLLCG